MTDDGERLIDDASQSSTPLGTEDVNPFLSHHAQLDAFVDDCNAYLRRHTAYHACEAFVTSQWDGHPVLTRVEMTNMEDARGVPVSLPVACLLPMPWRMKDDADRTVKSIMCRGLVSCDKGILEAQTRLKCLRVSFGAFSRSLSETIQTVSANGTGRKSSIIITP